MKKKLTVVTRFNTSSKCKPNTSDRKNHFLQQIHELPFPIPIPLPLRLLLPISSSELTRYNSS
ncbi:hypothetical protein Hanom_Chr07g00590641 [Helianthus anomalus]